MKRFLAVLLTLTMLLGVVSLSFVSFAAEDETEDTLVTKGLTLGEGQNYAFYAQTRDTKTEGYKDVRVICVADEAWLTAATTAHVNLTFTDGTTPITSKDLAFSTVYKEITAAGEVEGTTDVYTVAEGVVMFGWVVTTVPEAYADLTNHAPSASLTTDSTTNPETPSTPVLPGITSVTLEAAVDGVLAGAAANQGTYVNEMSNTNGGSVTFTLDGNYEGIWQMDVYYISGGDPGRVFNVDVNGVSQRVGCTDTGSWEDATTAQYRSINVELVDGENTIVVSAATAWAPNLVKLVMNKITLDYNAEVGSTFTLNAFNDGAITAGAQKSESETGNYVQNMGQENVGSLAFTLNGDYAGEYTLTVSYMSFGGRNLNVSVNGVNYVIECPASAETWDNATMAKDASVIINLKDGFNVILITAATEWAPNVIDFSFTANEDE